MYGMPVAQLILSGYDMTHINKSLKIIERYCKKTGLKMRKNPPIKNRIKPKSTMWGAQDDLLQKIADLEGDMESLKNIHYDVRIVPGIFLQLLLK